MTAVSEVRIRKLRDGSFEFELMQGPPEALSRFQIDRLTSGDGVLIVNRIQQDLWQAARQHDDAINAILD